jgi:hypothetical protein
MSLLGVALVACAHPGPPIRAGAAAARPATSEATRAAVAQPGAAEDPAATPLPMVTGDDLPVRDDPFDIDAFMAEAASIQSDEIDGPGGIRHFKTSPRGATGPAASSGSPRDRASAWIATRATITRPRGIDRRRTG